MSTNERVVKTDKFQCYIDPVKAYHNSKLFKKCIQKM